MNKIDFIVSGHFERGLIGFNPPLSKVQLYKLKKQLGKEDSIFLETIVGDSLDIGTVLC